MGAYRKGAPASGAGAEMPNAAAKPKRTLSAAGKKAVRAALKKRWAAFHAKTGAVKPAKQGAKRARTAMSPAFKAIARPAKANKRVTL